MVVILVSIGVILLSLLIYELVKILIEVEEDYPVVEFRIRNNPNYGLTNTSTYKIKEE